MAMVGVCLRDKGCPPRPYCSCRCPPEAQGGGKVHGGWRWRGKSDLEIITCASSIIKWPAWFWRNGQMWKAYMYISWGISITLGFSLRFSSVIWLWIFVMYICVWPRFWIWLYVRILFIIKNTNTLLYCQSPLLITRPFKGGKERERVCTLAFCAVAYFKTLSNELLCFCVWNISCQWNLCLLFGLYLTWVASLT